MSLLSNVETVNAAYTNKALAKSLMVYKPKVPDHYPRTGLYRRMTPQSTPPPQARNSSNGAGVKTILHPLYWPDLTAADKFLSRK